MAEGLQRRAKALAFRLYNRLFCRPLLPSGRAGSSIVSGRFLCFVSLLPQRNEKRKNYSQKRIKTRTKEITQKIPQA
jgi:hypothetical protein